MHTSARVREHLGDDHLCQFADGNAISDEVPVGIDVGDSSLDASSGDLGKRFLEELDVHSMAPLNHDASWSRNECFQRTSLHFAIAPNGLNAKEISMAKRRSSKATSKVKLKVPLTPRTSAALREILENVPEKQLLDHSGLNRGMLYMIKSGQANVSAETVGSLLGAMAVSSAEKLLQAFFEDVAARVAEEDPSVSLNCVFEVHYPPEPNP